MRKPSVAELRDFRVYCMCWPQRAVVLINHKRRSFGVVVRIRKTVQGWRESIKAEAVVGRKPKERAFQINDSSGWSLFRNVAVP